MDTLSKDYEQGRWTAHLMVDQGCEAHEIEAVSYEHAGEYAQAMRDVAAEREGEAGT